MFTNRLFRGFDTRPYRTVSSLSPHYQSNPDIVMNMWLCPNTKQLCVKKSKEQRWTEISGAHVVDPHCGHTTQFVLVNQFCDVFSKHTTNLCAFKHSLNAF